MCDIPCGAQCQFHLVRKRGSEEVIGGNARAVKLSQLRAEWVDTELEAATPTVRHIKSPRKCYQNSFIFLSKEHCACKLEHMHRFLQEGAADPVATPP